MLCVLSRRLERLGHKKEAEDALMLASASHDYVPITGIDGTDADKHWLGEKHRRWQRKYGRPVD
jgi:hypothetical protein